MKNASEMEIIMTDKRDRKTYLSKVASYVEEKTKVGVIH